ncbi:hypothetical protein LAWI1_G005034 [Lachnellula willkommii]|uniref:Uncharacterized protein n=1 Tax=Lachnellula willkommii TaxID=215461 RepID=A0A559MIW0_9HELO|nr:hypothetical protein LAWI1_G005034 [Lachnellula willkommii]
MYRGVNGELIMKRWKKSALKRKNYMLQVDPNIYPHQWCDAYFVHDFYLKAIERPATEGIEYDFTQGRERRSHPNVCLLPYINLEGLMDEPARFLSLLYNRTRYSPQDWAPHDNLPLGKQFELGALETFYNRSCIIMHGEEYGKLIEWHKEKAHGWNYIGFPRGILILQAQQRLLRFLRKVVDQVLVGTNGNWAPGQINAIAKAFEHGFGKVNETSSAVEFASPYLNQPFSTPPVFDIQALLSIAQSRLNMHEDHLWLLQTDPAYTRRYISHSWESILEEVLKVQDVHLKFKNVIHSDEPLPEPYERALASLEALLNHQIEYRSKYIKRLLPFRPGFHQNFKFTNFSRLQSMAVLPVRLDKAPSLPEVFFKDELDCCLRTLAGDNVDPVKAWIPNATPQHNHATLFAVLDEHLTQCRREGRKEEVARLDEVLYSEFSDLAAIHQMLDMVGLHRPHCAQRGLEGIGISETSKGWRYINKHFFAQDSLRGGKVGPDGRWHDTEYNPMKEAGSQKIAAEQRLAKLMNEFLATPKPTSSRIRQEWLDQDASQRAALSQLWAGARDRHRQTLQRLDFDENDIVSDLKVLSADSHPDYIISLRNERDEIRAKIVQRTRKHQMVNEQMVALNLEVHIPDIKPKFEFKEVKAKTKTRSVANPPPIPVGIPQSQSLSEAAQELPTQIQVSVSKSALAIFHSMFPSRSSEEASQKSVKWDSFVLAMAEPELGFVARHSAGGSAVQFEPNERSKWFWEGKIVFHKPHPVPVIDPVMLSSMGKRLRKWFGWDNETFLLKGKN